MEHVIAFPGLGLEFTINRVAFTVFGKEIYWYGIIICVGFILAALYLNFRVKKFGFTSDNLIDCMIICVPVGVVCARLYYVVFEWEYYSQHPAEIVAVWNGGIAIYGAVIGVLIALFAYSRFKKLSFAGLCDMAALGLLIGQCIGRWGNFINREAFGRETAAFSRMGLTLPGQETVYVHPTFLYESLWNFAGFLMLHFWFRKHERRFDGELILLYAVWYGIGRALIEGLRTDSLYITGTGIRVSQLLAGVSAAAAAVVLALLYTGKLRHPPRYVDRESGETQQDA